MDIKTKQMSLEEIQKIVLKLRNDGEIDSAIDLCIESSENNKASYFFPKIIGDLYLQKNEFDLASNYYISFLTKITKNHKLFGNFAKRYYRLKRLWSHEKISKFAYRLFSTFQEGKINADIWNLCKDLIKDDLYYDVRISVVGKKFCNLINDDANFNEFVKHTKIMEKDNQVELEYLLDRNILKRERNISYFRIDAYCISIYERFSKNKNALKIASEILSVKTESSVVRTIFRICRQTKDYRVAENITEKYPEILKNSDFNIQYELVYYFEDQNQIEEVHKILLQMEKRGKDSISIQKTVRNFYLTFGFIDDADRTGTQISKISSVKKNVNKKVSDKFSEEIIESEAEVGSKIKELYSQLEHQKQLAAISDLTTGISHELGQPITNIRYTIQFYYKIFQKNISRDTIFEVFDSILEETERMGTLVKRLSPITSGKNVIAKFDIIGNIKKRVEAESKITDKDYNIKFRIVPQKKIYIEGDSVHFDQIISNLLLNAIDSIKQKNKKNGNLIQIVVNEKKEYVEIIFSDTGTGIDAKNRSKIFDPFFTTKPPGTGQGLGLFIIWNLIKRHGGKIYLDHKYTNGAKFVIKLPNISKYINKKEIC